MLTTRSGELSVWWELRGSLRGVLLREDSGPVCLYALTAEGERVRLDLDDFLALTVFFANSTVVKD